MSNLRWAWGLAILVLAACSGSGSDSESNLSKPTDSQSPVITLQGSNDLIVPYASVYEDAGAAAEDNVDGAVSVSVSGEVNTEVPGDYVITYTATDTAGNTATAERRVAVEAEKVLLTLSIFGEGEHSISNMTSWECRSDGRICHVQLNAGETVSITANEAPGWEFYDWVGCDEVLGSVCSITANGDRALFSYFADQSPVEYWSDVVFLTETQINSISSITNSSNIIVFAAGADISDIEIGSVLVSNGTDANPMQFAKRVRDIVQLSGSPAYLEVIDVPLSDVVKRGAIIFEVDLSAADFSAYTASQSASPISPSSTSTGPLATSTSPLVEPADAVAKFTVSLEGLSYAFGSGSEITPNGSVDFIFYELPKLGIYIDDDGREYYSYAADAGYHGDFGVKFDVAAGDSAGVSKDGKADIPLGPPIPLGAVPVPFPIPLFITAEMLPMITVDIKAGASFETKFVGDAHGTVGALWSAQYGADLLLDSGEWNWTPTLVGNAEGSLEVKAGPAARVNFEINTVAGPYFEAAGYGGIEVTRSLSELCDGKFKAFAGIKVAGGGQLSVFTAQAAYEVASVKFEGVLYETDLEFCDAVTTDITPPGNVTRPVLSILDSSTIRVLWEKPDEDVGILQYEVYRAEGANGVPRRVAESPTTEFDDNGLNEQTEYCYYIIAVDIAGNRSSRQDNSSCARTPASLQTQSPASPMISNAEAVSSTAILLEWGDSTGTGENIQYSVYDVGTDSSTEYLVAHGASTTIYVTQLNPETEYCFQVYASDAYGNSSLGSNIRCVSTLPNSSAAWTMLIGCQGRDWLIEQQIDLDEEITSVVQAVGSGNDYDGQALTYALAGAYYASTSILQADIAWSFEESPDQRLDRFEADLTGGDSGVVFMDQIQVTGCDAQIQFIRSESSTTTSGTHIEAASVGDTSKVGAATSDRKIFER